MSNYVEKTLRELLDAVDEWSEEIKLNDHRAVAGEMRIRSKKIRTQLRLRGIVL